MNFFNLVTGRSEITNWSEMYHSKMTKLYKMDHLVTLGQSFSKVEYIN